MEENPSGSLVNRHDGVGTQDLSQCFHFETPLWDFIDHEVMYVEHRCVPAETIQIEDVEK